MDTCLFHRGEAHHRAFQFSFERPLIVDVLHEFGGAKVVLVEKFEADATALGQTRGGQSQPRFGQLIRGNQNRAAIIGEPVFNGALFQFLNDTGGIFRRHRSIKRAEIAFMLEMNKSHHGGAGGESDHQDRKPLPHGEAGDEFGQLVHSRVPADYICIFMTSW